MQVCFLLSCCASSPVLRLLLPTCRALHFLLRFLQFFQPVRPGSRGSVTLLYLLLTPALCHLQTS